MEYTVEQAISILNEYSTGGGKFDNALDRLIKEINDLNVELQKEYDLNDKLIEKIKKLKSN